MKNWLNRLFKRKANGAATTGPLEPFMKPEKIEKKAEQPTSPNTIVKLYPTSESSIVGILSKSPGNWPQPQAQESEVTVNELEANALKNAISAELMEKSLKANSVQSNTQVAIKKFKRGDKVRHTKTGEKLVIVVPDVDTSKHGNIRHEVVKFGHTTRMRVPEKNLEHL